MSRITKCIFAVLCGFVCCLCLQSTKAYAADLTIMTAADLVAFSERVNAGETFEGKVIELGADIAFNSGAIDNFTTAGVVRGTDFKGTFDGNNHVISGIYQSFGKYLYYGLFYRNQGTIKNLILDNYSFIGTGTSTKGTPWAGAIAATNLGLIVNCEVRNSDMSVSVEYGVKSLSTAGFIVASNGFSGVIDVCRVSDSTADVYGVCGGLAGSNDGSIINSGNFAQINTYYASLSYFRDNEFFYGGIAGKTSGLIENCISICQMQIGQDSWKGRYGSLAGRMNGSGKINNCVGDAVYSGKATKGFVFGELAAGSTISNIYYCKDSNEKLCGYDYGANQRNVLDKTTEYLKSGVVDDLNQVSSVKSVPWVKNPSGYPVSMKVFSIDSVYTEKGTITIDRDYTYVGNTVSFTVKPEKYYTVSKVEVKKKDGKGVGIDSSNGKYVFLMPSSDVKVSVGFTYSVPIKDCTISLSNTSYTYDGYAKKPIVSVKLGSTPLVLGTDYEVKYTGNVDAGKGQVTVSGKGVYTGTVTKSFVIEKATQIISGPASGYTKKYNDKAFSLKAKVTKGNGKLSYVTGDKSVATVTKDGKVTPKACGYTSIKITASETKNYKETTKVVNVTVTPGKTTLSSVKSVGKKKIQVNWAAQKNVTGYIIEYSLYSDFYKAKSVTVKGTASKTGEIKKATPGKRYYVRVKSYKVTKTGQKVYGAYSKKKLSPVVKK